MDIKNSRMGRIASVGLLALVLAGTATSASAQYAQSSGDAAAGGFALLIKIGRAHV